MHAAPSAGPRVFISHSHQDDDETYRLAEDLRARGAQVWLDTLEVSRGVFLQRINEALASCDWLVVVLTPSALESEWVQLEVSAALGLVVRGRMRAVIPVIAKPCNEAAIPPMWDVMHRYDAVRDYDGALAGLCRAFGLPSQPVQSSALPTRTRTDPPAPTPAPTPAPPVRHEPPPPVPSGTTDVQLSAERFPRRLAGMGFVAKRVGTTDFIVPPTCQVAAGPFQMGSDPQEDTGAYRDEQPRHEVTLPAYAIARYPATVAEYACFVATGHRAPPDWQRQLAKPDYPVVSVSWTDAVAYAAWLAHHTGAGWRLPTEAEWEKAARWEAQAGHARRYPWGDTFEDHRANTKGSGINGPSPLGRYSTSASPYGVEEMAGNVWQWTHSRYRPYPYNPSDGREAPEQEGVPAEVGATRVLRGGCWRADARDARSAFREDLRAAVLLDYVGFRLVLASHDATGN